MSLAKHYSLYVTGDLRPAQLAHAPEQARELAKALIAEPAYSDPRHRAHQSLMADVRALYEIATPEAQP